MGNACDHNLCDEESLCRFCRVFGYGNWPELPERMKHFAAMLDAACGRPGVRPLTYDEMVVLRSTLVEARLKLQEMTERQAAMDELARLDEETKQ